MIDENIVQLPTLLDRLANKLTNYLSQEAANREEWIAIQEGICLTLVEARDQFLADIEFGRWCETNGFGAKIVRHEARAAAIAMGREPEALRKCLEATERRSLLQIHRFDFSRFRYLSKPISRRKQRKVKPATKTNKAREVVAPLLEQGKPVDFKGIADELGVSQLTVRVAVSREQGRFEGLKEAPPLDPADMTKNMKARYEAALRKARKELREEVTVEVQREFDVYVKYWKEKIERADRILVGFKGHISKAAFRQIKACLHPDHNSFAHAAEALRIFSELEDVLVKPDEPPSSASPLPATAAELMARRRHGR